MGLNGVCIMAFDSEAVQKALQLPLVPQLLIAIGRSAERIEIVDITEGDSQTYYRSNGVHFVPKLRVKELIIE